MKARIDELKDLINEYNRLYYIEESPVVSDFEYDKLFAELKDLEEKNPELVTADSPTQRVGALGEKFQPHKHTYRLYSLDNTYSYDEISAWEEKQNMHIGRDMDFVCELKIDGLAVALTYKDGLLVRGATRGDGIVGEDITANIKTIKAIPLKISEKIDLEIRGEIFMPKSSFDRLNRENLAQGEKVFANPRNAASGSLRQLDSRITAKRDLSMFCYTAIFVDGVEQKPKTHYEAIMYLKKLGFKTNPNIRVCKNSKEIIDYCEEWAEKRFDLDYATDGVVIKVNQFDIQDELGFTARAPKWATAFKFPPEEAITTLKSIELGVGKTGAITPIANLEPVALAGSTVARASLYNFDEIRRLDLRIGDRVVIKKAAEIIPKIITVVEDENHKNLPIMSIPTTCPVCGEELKLNDSEIGMYCPNSECPAKVKSLLEFWTSGEGLDIDFLGPSIISQLYELGLVRTFADFYKLTILDLMRLDLVQAKTANNIYNAIQKSKDCTLAKFLTALSIRNIGKETAGALANEFKTLEAIMCADEQEFTRVEGVALKVAHEVYSYFHNSKNVAVIEELLSLGIKPKNVEVKKSDKLQNMNFVLTGTLSSMTRNEAQEKIVLLGGKATSAVTSKTNFLIAGENAGSKFDKAQKLGVNILTEEEFLKLIEEGI